jgi:hypothetical protein
MAAILIESANEEKTVVQFSLFLFVITTLNLHKLVQIRQGDEVI